MPRRPLPRSLRRLGGESGSVLVEFGLVAPVMALLTCAIIDFSMAMFTMNNLTLAVREGGRLASTLPTPVAANDPRVQARVNEAIVAMGNARPGYQITVQTQSAGGLPPVGNITVEIRNYSYVPVTPMARLFGMETISMNRRAVFRHELSN